MQSYKKERNFKVVFLKNVFLLALTKRLLTNALHIFVSVKAIRNVVQEKHNGDGFFHRLLSAQISAVSFH